MMCRELHSSGYYAGAPKEEVAKGKIIFYEEGSYGTIAVKNLQIPARFHCLLTAKGRAVT